MSTGELFTAYDKMVDDTLGKLDAILNAQLTNAVETSMAEAHYKSTIKQNATAERVNPTMTDAEKDKQKLRTYNAKDYHRLAFDSQASRNKFVNEMRSRGVEDVAFLESRVNGKYLVEIPHNTTVLVPREEVEDKKSVFDEYAEEDDRKREELVRQEVTAQSLINDYQNKYFETVQTAKSQTAQEVDDATAETVAKNNTTDFAGGMVGGFMQSELGMLGTAIYKTNYAIDTAHRWGVHISEENKKLFTTELSKEDKEKGVLPDIRKPMNSNAKVATVLNDSIVVIDGKVVTGRVRDQVLAQHQMRQKQTEGIIKKGEKWDAKHGAKVEKRREKFDLAEEKRRERFAEKKEQKLERAIEKYDKRNAEREERFDLKEEMRLEADGVKQKGDVFINQATGQVAKSREELKKTYKPSAIPAIVQKRKIDHIRGKEYHAKQFRTGESQKRRIMRENAKMIQQNLHSEQHYVTTELKSAASYKATVFDNFVENFNYAAVLYTMQNSGVGGFALPSEELSFLKRQFGDGNGLSFNLSAEDKDVISQILKQGGTGSFREQDVLNSFVKNLEKSGAKFSADEKSMLSELKAKTMLTVEQRQSLGTFHELARNIKKDFDIDITKGELTRSDIFKIQNKFIDQATAKGLVVVTPLGNINTEMLKKLPLKSVGNEMSWEKIGMSEASRKFILEISKKGASGKFDIKAYAGEFQLATKLANKAANDKETNELQSYGRNVYKGTKTTAKATREIIAIVNKKIEIAALKHDKLKVLNKQIKVPKPKVVDKVKEALTKPVKTPYGNKLAKTKNKVREWKLKFSEKNPYTKAKNGINKVKQKIGDTKLVKALNKIKSAVSKVLLKVMIYFLIAAAFLALIICVVAAIIVIIQSFMDFLNGIFEADSYDDTVAWHLTESLQNQEQAWLAGLVEYDIIFENRESCQFGEDKLSYQDYVNNSTQLAFDEDGNLCINPFHLITTDDRFFTTIDSYNGINNTVITANANIYSSKTGSDINGNHFSAENGHTSNIKDIVGMADICFQMELNKGSDTGLESIMGEVPEKLNWDNFWNNFTAAFEMMQHWWDNVCEFFSWLFSGGEDHPNYITMQDLTTGETLSYQTLENYGAMVFQMSHDMRYDLVVTYCDNIGDVYVNNGSTHLSTSESLACELGYCTAPDFTKFAIHYSVGSGKIFPTIYTDSGEYANLGSGSYDVTITMDMLSDDPSTLCLWDGMASDAATLTRIQEYIAKYEYDSLHSCWTKMRYSDDLISGTYYNTYGAWYETVEEAQNAIKNSLRNQWNNSTVNSDDDYVLDSSHNAFTHTYFEKYDYDDSEISYGTLEEKTVYDAEPYYWTGEITEDLNGDGEIDGLDCNGNMSTSEDYEDNGIVAEGYLIGFNVDEYEVDYDEEYFSPSKMWRETGYYYTDYDGDGYDEIVYEFEYATAHGKKQLYDHLASRNLAYRLGYYSTAMYTDFDKFPAIQDGSAWDVIGRVSGCYSGYYVEIYNTTLISRTQYRYPSATAPFQEFVRDVYQRDCRTCHQFKYCGGHLGIHTTGNVMSVTNEHLSVVAVSENSYIAEDADEELYKEIRGKYKEFSGSDISDMKSGVYTAGTVANNWQGDSILVHPQGSLVAQRGVNIKVVGGTWDGNPSIQRTDIPFAYLRDIFDSDCLVDKSRNLFPIPHTNYWEFPAWNASNMELAVAKAGVDWAGIYEFNIPMEIGGANTDEDDEGVITIEIDEVCTISDEDIEKIIQGLIANYGEGVMSEQRVEACKFALQWVGRGHYSDNHSDHNFLSTSCNTQNVVVTDVKGNVVDITKYDASCTAGDSKSFAWYYMYMNGMIDTPNSTAVSFPTQTSTANYQPADVIKCDAVTLSDLTLNGTDTLLLSGNEDTIKTFNMFKEPVYTIYLGELAHDVTLTWGTKTVTLPANQPLTVDLSKDGYFGCVRLRYKNATGWLSLDGDEVFYFVNNPTSSSASVGLKQFPD